MLMGSLALSAPAPCRSGIRPGGRRGVNAHSLPAATWTPDLVGRAMIEAFRALPRTAIFAPRRGDLRVTAGPEGPAAVIGWAALYLPDASDERKYLLAWARTMATKGDDVESLNQLIKGMGWVPRTFHRKRRKACETIAAGLNRDGVAPVECPASPRA